jgi:hypothetical protein
MFWFEDQQQQNTIGENLLEYNLEPNQEKG